MYPFPATYQKKKKKKKNYPFPAVELAMAYPVEAVD